MDRNRTPLIYGLVGKFRRTAPPRSIDNCIPVQRTGISPSVPQDSVVRQAVRQQTQPVSCGARRGESNSRLGFSLSVDSYWVCFIWPSPPSTNLAARHWLPASKIQRLRGAIPMSHLFCSIGIVPAYPGVSTLHIYTTQKRFHLSGLPQ